MELTHITIKQKQLFIQILKTEVSHFDKNLDPLFSRTLAAIAASSLFKQHLRREGAAGGPAWPPISLCRLTCSKHPPPPSPEGDFNHWDSAPRHCALLLLEILILN